MSLFKRLHALIWFIMISFIKILIAVLSRIFMKYEP